MLFHLERRLQRAIPSYRAFSMAHTDLRTGYSMNVTYK